MELLLPSLIAPFLQAASVGLLSIGAVYFIRRHRQRRADHMHETFEVEMGGEIKMDAVYGFLHALSGLDKPRWLEPVHTVTFERYANGTEQDRYFIHIPGHMDERVEQWIEEHLDLPIEKIDRDQDPVRLNTWEAAIELEAGTGTLDIVDPIQQSITIGSRFRHMVEGEQLVTQVTVYPARRQAPTPETKDKQASNTFNAIIRVGGSGGARPDLMVKDVLSGLKSLDNERAFFRKHPVLNAAKRINQRAGLMEYPNLVNEKELITLLAWPLSGSAIVRARRLAPTSAHDSEGIVLGESDSSRARGRKIAISMEGLTRHVHLLGGTGVGKSNLLQTIALEGIKKNMAVIVIEPAGDLVYDILDRIPESAVDRVVLLDPTDVEFPVGIAVFSGDDPERTTGHIVGMFKTIAGDSWGGRLERILRNTVLTAAINKLTFYDLLPLLTNKHYRSEQVKRISRAHYPLVHEEWDWLERTADMAVDSVVNKITAFLGYETVRNIVAQKKGLDFDAIIRDHKILLVPLPAARIGLTSAQALGQLVTELLWDAAQRQLQGQRNPSLAIIDEVQHFGPAIINPESNRLAEARKFLQTYALANQYVKQLDPPVMESIKMNVQNQIVFRLAIEDAERVASTFAPLKPAEIAALAQYSVAARLTGSQGYAPTVTLKTSPPTPPTGFRQQIIANTRLRYARPAAEIRAEIAARHKGPEPKQRPIIGNMN